MHLFAAGLGGGEARDAFDYAYQRWRKDGVYMIVELVGHSDDAPRLVGGIYGHQASDVGGEFARLRDWPCMAFERGIAEHRRYPVGMAEEAHVTLSGDIEGAYVVIERGPGNELRIAPDTSWKAILERTGGREATEEEIAAFEREHGPFLPPDGEGRPWRSNPAAPGWSSTRSPLPRT
jgi:hypothetical protein